MATEQQLIEGIRRADASGDNEGVQVLGKQLLAMRSAPKAPPQARKMGTARATAIGTANGISGNFLDRMAAGIGAVLPDMGPSHASVWNGHSLGDAYDLNLQQVRGYKGDLYDKHPVATGAGEVAGAIGTTAALGGAGLIGDMAYGATYGAGGSKDLRNVKDVAKNVALNSGMALGGNLAGRAVAKTGGAILRGAKRSAPAQLLKDSGIMPTIGQSLGKGAKAFEDRLSGMPIVGGPIRSMRAAQYGQMLKAGADEVLAPLGIKAQPAATGHELYSTTMDVAEQAYREALGSINGPVDDAFKEGLAKASMHRMTAPQREVYNDILDNVVGPRLRAGQLDGAGVQDIKEVLDKQIRSLANTPGHSGTADALKQVRATVFDWAERNTTNPDAYKAARQAWGRAKILADAVKRSNTDGVPTANQLVAATRKAEKYYGKDAFARQNVPLQKLAQTASQVLPSTIPDPGTAGQFAFGKMLTSPVKSAGGIGGAMVAGIPYSAAGNKAVQSILFDRPDLMIRAGNAANKLSTPLGLFGGGLAATRGGR